MPEFAIKEVRLPELHLPEIERDEIVRALSGVHLPKVDLARPEAGNPLARLRPAMARWRGRGLPPVDPGKVLAAAVTASRLLRLSPPRSRWSRIRRSPGNLLEIVRPAQRRSRRRVVAVVALALAAVAGWVLLRAPASRARLDRAAQRARQWIAERRADRSNDVALDAGEAVSMATSEPATPVAVATEETASTVA